LKAFEKLSKIELSFWEKGAFIDETMDNWNYSRKAQKTFQQ
jgi:hypothetical protein